MCSSLNAMVNGDNVTTFQCVPNKVCKWVNFHYKACTFSKKAQPI
ncbi:hypothetical protein ANCDUO_06255 [Ancylostoma duodenale]|uniref:Uncharacterized protein n=1 Tax=Ancylostoma duodenale TaxID=51022 RepID=A0A0C2GQ27_9BILA|nr:hypothetical protein ANCDUO_06255 [Ancylostoma duodenale]